MNKFVDKCRPLAVVLGLLGAGGVMGQVVQVPAGCVVRIPGVGGGGANVGDGGLVEMPASFDIPGAGGNFVCVGFVGTTPNWSLLGDLSVQTAIVQAGPPPGTSPVQSASGTTVNIESYNKVVRQVESDAPSVATHARSKGRVTIRWNDGTGCGRILTFDILKKWGNPASTMAGPSYAPGIVGPNCWGTGLITFSVDQVSSDNGTDAIGYDQYYWNITNGAGVILPYAAFNNTSDDRSSITINQSSGAFLGWLTGGPYQIRACFGRCNGWDLNTSLLTGSTAVNNYILSATASPQTCVIKPMNPAPVTPTFTPASPLCLSTSATTQTITYSTAGILSATWSGIPANWTSTASLGTLTLGSMDGNPATLQLTAVGPCGSNVYTYQINRVFTTTQLSTTPAPIACLNGDGTSTVTVSVGPNAQGNPTCWTAAPPWPFTTNGANSTRVYTVPAGTCAGTYTFTARSCACTTVSSSVTVRVRPANPVLTGPTCVPSGGGAVQTYNSTTPCGTTGFTWSNNLGMTGTSTTSSIGYTPAGTANGLVQVIANGVAGSGCNSNPVTINVNRNPVPPVVTPGQTCYSTGQNTVATFTSSGGAATQWTFPPGMANTTTATGATATISVNGLAAGTTYNCTASITNSCGTATTPFTVTIPAYTVALDLSGSVPGVFTEIKAVPQQGSTNYSLWNCQTNSVVQGPQTGNTFTLSNGGSGSFTIIVDPLPVGGCVQRPPCQTTEFNSAMEPQGGNNGEVLPGTKGRVGDDSDISISPNPNTGMFAIGIAREFNVATAMLYDAQGRQVGRPQRLKQGLNPLQGEELAQGKYTVVIDVDGQLTRRSVVVTK